MTNQIRSLSPADSGEVTFCSVTLTGGTDVAATTFGTEIVRRWHQAPADADDSRAYGISA